MLLRIRVLVLGIPVFVQLIELLNGSLGRDGVLGPLSHILK